MKKKSPNGKKKNLLAIQEATCSIGVQGSIPRLRAPGEGNGNPLQHYWGNLMDRGSLWAAVLEVARVGHELATKPQ